MNKIYKTYGRVSYNSTNLSVNGIADKKNNR